MFFKLIQYLVKKSFSYDILLNNTLFFLFFLYYARRLEVNYFVLLPIHYMRCLFFLNQVITHYLHVVRTSYRLLVVETNVFSKYWDWSCFLDFVTEVVNLDQGSDISFQKDISDIRWCGIRILSVILNMNDKAVSKFGVGAEEAHSCFLRYVYLHKLFIIDSLNSFCFIIDRAFIFCVFVDSSLDSFQMGGILPRYSY